MSTTRNGQRRPLDVLHHDVRRRLHTIRLQIHQGAGGNDPYGETMGIESSCDLLDRWEGDNRLTSSNRALAELDVSGSSLSMEIRSLFEALVGTIEHVELKLRMRSVTSDGSRTANSRIISQLPTMLEQLTFCTLPRNPSFQRGYQNTTASDSGTQTPPFSSIFPNSNPSQQPYRDPQLESRRPTSRAASTSTTSGERATPNRSPVRRDSPVSAQAPNMKTEPTDVTANMAIINQTTFPPSAPTSPQLSTPSPVAQYSPTPSQAYSPQSNVHPYTPSNLSTSMSPPTPMSSTFPINSDDRPPMFEPLRNSQSVSTPPLLATLEPKPYFTQQQPPHAGITNLGQYSTQSPAQEQQWPQNLNTHPPPPQ